MAKVKNMLFSKISLIEYSRLRLIQPRLTQPADLTSHFGLVRLFKGEKSTSDITASRLLQPLWPGPEVAGLSEVYCRIKNEIIGWRLWTDRV